MMVVVACLCSCDAYVLSNSLPYVAHGRVSELTMMATIAEPSNLTPLEDQVLVQMQLEPDASAGGILLPVVFIVEQEDAFARPEVRQATVIAMGPGKLAKDGSRVPMPSVEVGQSVIIGPNKGIKIQEEGKILNDCSYFLCKAEDIWTAVA